MRFKINPPDISEPTVEYTKPENTAKNNISEVY